MLMACISKIIILIERTHHKLTVNDYVSKLGNPIAMSLESNWNSKNIIDFIIIRIWEFKYLNGKRKHIDLDSFNDIDILRFIYSST